MNIFKKVNGQKGYALVLVLLFLMLSTLIGAALLTNTLNSHKAVMAGENDTKAKYLAEYGANYGLDALYQELEAYNRSDKSNWTWETMQKKIDELRKFRGEGTPDSSNSREKFTYYLELEDEPERYNEVMGEYVINGYLYATGEANGQTVTFRVPIQITNIADVFNFALTAKENIWLNGGVKINGSVYAGNKIGLHNIAHFYNTYRCGLFSTCAQYQQETVYPEINGKISAGPSSDQTHYLVHVPKQGNEDTYPGNHSFKGLNPISPNDVSKYLNGNYRLEKTKDITFPKLDMEDIKEEIKETVDFDNKVKDGFNEIHKKVGGVDYYYITGAKGCGKNNSCSYEEYKTKYEIGADHKKKGPFKGVYFINGDLNIKGDIRLEGTFYVYGKVSIQYTKRTENPIAAAIIAYGEIQIANNNLYQSEPAILNSFFWSLEDDFVIYGVGSHLQINGGVIANNLVLNAVRGDTVENNNGKLVFENPQTTKRYSRLTVNYDEKFITHPPAGVPTNEGFSLKQIGQWEYVQ